MRIVKVRTADGQEIVVDADRFNAFHQFFAQDANLTASLFGQRQDSAEAIAFLVGQLTYTEAQVYETMTIPLQYKDLVPLDFGAGEWAKNIRYEVFDYAGQGKRSSGMGNNINLVDVAYADKMFPVVNGDIGYAYSMEELRETAHLGRAMPTIKQAAAMNVYQQHMNKVALTGEDESSLTGLFNSDIVPTITAPNTDLLNETTPATPAEILDTINAGIFTLWENTGFNEYPTDIVLPPALMAKIGSTARSDNSDKTILMFLKENNIAKVQGGRDVNFTAGIGLESAGAAGVGRIVYYVKSPLRVVMHIPMPLRFLDPQRLGLGIQVPGEYKYSGVTFRYPKSALYMDGATAAPA